MLKRIFDVTVSATLLLLLWPLMLIVALAVRLDSPGPIFFRAARVGQHGHTIRLFKFRTMRVGADKEGNKITIAGDARVTRVGRVLRRTKLDELPQLMNVLRGEMSLVGPRPEDPRYVAHYTPEQRAVLSVRPGITSPASVHFRDEESLLTDSDWESKYLQEVLPAKLAIDLEYVRHADLWRDLRVLFETFLALFR